MGDPLEYFDKVNFNTRNFDTTNHIIEYLPPPGIEKKIRFCRCWQSKKFPYCDDTHKAMNEGGDSLGPFIAIIKNEEPTAHHRIKLRNRLDNKITTNIDMKNKMAFRSAKLALALLALASSYYCYNRISNNMIKYKSENQDKFKLATHY